jgi:hypothetical protein
MIQCLTRGPQNVSRTRDALSWAFMSCKAPENKGETALRPCHVARPPGTGAARRPPDRTPDRPPRDRPAQGGKLKIYYEVP